MPAAQLGDQLGRLHAAVEGLSRQGRLDHLLPDLPAELVPTYARLLEAEVPEALARRLVRHVAERDRAGRGPPARGGPRGPPRAPSRHACRSRRRSPPWPARRRVVALVGPTGVGKTTTVAKLAANAKLGPGPRASAW